MEKTREKGGIVLKPVGQTWVSDCWLTVWSLMTPGQVLAGSLCSDVSPKTICRHDSIKGNQPARKPLVIAQPVFSAGRVQNEVMAGKEEN